VAEPDQAAAAFHAERHTRFRRIIAALKTAQISTERAGGPADWEEGTV
jgi:hypothetical protein